MWITKCDLCKKVIKKEEESVGVKFESYEHAELCGACGSPILKFLQKNKFLKKEKDKRVKIL